MALKKFIYPLDLTGERQSNRVEENHVIGTDRYRAFALSNGPFYTHNLRVKERSSGKLLTRGDDYECVFFYDELAALTPGREICGVIVIHNVKITNDIVVNGNVVGGPFSASGALIQQAIDALELDHSPTYWAQILEKPDLFQPTPHMHDFGDVFGFEFIVDVLGAIKDALVIGDAGELARLGKRLTEIESNLKRSIEDHVKRTDDPHNVTNEQVNAYTKEYIDELAQSISKSFADDQESFNAVDTELTAINERINGLVQSIDNSHKQFSQAMSKQSRLDKLIAEVNRAIDTINDRIDVVNTEIASLHQRDQELQAAIEAVDRKVAAEKQRNDGQDNRLDQIDSKNNEQDTAIENLQKKNEQQDTAHTELVKRVDDLQEYANGIAQHARNNTSSIEGLQNRVRSLETKPEPKPKVHWGGVQITSYLNNFDSPVDWTAPHGTLMCGVYSYHSNGCEDRRFRYRYRSINVTH